MGGMTTTTTSAGGDARAEALPRAGAARGSESGRAPQRAPHQRGRAASAAPACRPGDPGFEERYRAIDARDTRFDGQFFTAVASTGIYCRPSCPARTPKRENVSFYLTSAAAHEAGYRACKRCLPEATPGSPEWDLRRDAAGRAMRLVGDGVVDREGVDGLARRLGYTSRHLGRILVAELGASPLALARARRAQTARSLLVGTDLPIADVAFAAGFGSVRQFNETVQDVFDASPSRLRAAAQRGARSRSDGPAPTTRTGATGTRTGAVQLAAAEARTEAGAGADALVRLEVDLPVRQPFDAPGVLAFLAPRAIAGVDVAETLDDGRLRYARTLSLPHGPGAVDVLAAPAERGRWRLRARLELASLADVATAVSRIRRLFDLDADPDAVDDALSRDPALAPLVASAPGMRVPGAVDPHELVVRALVGQQISVAAARTHLGRLVSIAGTPYSSAFPGLTRLFPSAAQIAQHVPEPVDGETPDPARPLRLPARTVRTVIETARALRDGELAVHVGADPAELRERLVARPGIGEWTARYISMRVLGDPDAWLAGDVALVAGARALRLLPGPSAPPGSGTGGTARRARAAPADHRVLAERAAAWAPWRSYAAMHVWSAAAGAPATNETRKTNAPKGTRR